MKQVFVTDYNCITSLGFNVQENIQNIMSYKTGIQEIVYPHKKDCFVAQINNDLLEEKFTKVESKSTFSRIEKISILALYDIIQKNKVTENDLLILSTTKGDIKSIENNRLPQVAFLSSLADTISNYFGFKKEPLIVSNACVSGVLAIATAKKIIKNTTIEKVYIIAVDEISNFVISGFNCFQALSNSPCKPYDADRDGVSLGEAAVGALVTSTPSSNCYEVIGESSVNDANHISGPSRTGEGLFESINNALKESKLSPEEIDFISAHGTATPYNDEMESIAFERHQLNHKPINSLKGYYGHTLGASGLLETIISMEASNQDTILATLGFQKNGTSKEINVHNQHITKKINYFLKTASGFGGSNTAVLFKKI